MARRLIELKPDQEWDYRAEGLHFVLARRGQGECATSEKQPAQPISPGDVVVANGQNQGGIRAVNGSPLVFQHFVVRFEHLVCLFTVRETSLLQSLVESFRPARHYPASSALSRECQELMSGVPEQTDLHHRCHLLRVVAVVLTASGRIPHSWSSS